MDQNQQELRRAAAQAFAQSLGQLEKTLQPSEEAAMKMGDRPAQTLYPDRLEPANPAAASLDLDIETLEAAAADIERFIQARTGAEPSVSET
ncbi:MAG: hypothetical protein HC772_01510 [Leptolyngbyaceae cyanobacterium CRU_2_3]|nr:hypothetical protein [Leptolyngbyaceae cyanobacterium CRU_2_3]